MSEVPNESRHPAPGERLQSAVLAIKALSLLVCAMLLVSCGRVADPPFVGQTGDLGAFLGGALSRQVPLLPVTNELPVIQTAWHARVLTQRHQSGEYLEGREALQIRTATANYSRVEQVFTTLLGQPTQPLRQEPGNWRHISWSRPAQGLGVWLVEDEEQCKIEVVTETRKERSAQ